MIKLNNLIDLLPSYFKEYDSYKDSSGQGLLEKFLNICGEYFQTENLPDLDNFLENHSVSDIDELYINNLWEFLGEFPFLQSDNFNPVTFAQLFNGDNLAEAKSLSRIKINNILNDLWGNNPRYTVRNTLPYVISFYKVRGTALFYDILFRLLNLTNTIRIVESYNDLSAEAKSRVPEYLYDSSVALFKYTPKFEEAEFDKTNVYDIGAKCNTCIARYFEVNTNNLTGDINKFVQAIEGVIDKFSPFYLNPVIVYTGNKASQLYDYNIRVNSPSPVTLVQGSMAGGNYFPGPNNVGEVKANPYQDVEVLITGRNPRYLVGYRSENTVPFVLNSSTEHSSKIYRILSPGQYVFIPLDYIISNPGALSREIVEGLPTGLLTFNGSTSSTNINTKSPVLLNVTERVITSQYTIRGQVADNSPSVLDKLGDVVLYNVIAALNFYLTDTDISKGKDSLLYSNYFKYISENIVCIESPSGDLPTGKVGSLPGQPGNTLMQFELTEKGKYVFAVPDTPLRHEFVVGATEKYDKEANTVDIVIRPSKEFLIRNNDFNAGTGTYSTSTINARGIKGAYYLHNGIYKPSDLVITLNCRTRQGKPVNIKIGNELIRVNERGDASYTLPKVLGVYSIKPENHPEFTPLTLNVRGWEDPVQVNAQLMDWYINPSGSMTVEEDSILSMNGYATVGVTPTNKASDYHPCFVMVQGTSLPTAGSLYPCTLGKGIPQTPEGQEVKVGGVVIGRLFTMNLSSGNTYSCAINLKVLSSYKGSWVTFILKDLSNFEVLGIQGGNNLLGRRRFNLMIPSYITTNFGFFSIKENKEDWSNLSTNSYAQMASSSDAYIGGTAHWSQEHQIVPLSLWLASLKTSTETSAIKWGNVPFQSLIDTEGNNLPFQEWSEDASLEDSGTVEYTYPLQGSPKVVRFSGVREDGSSQELFRINMVFPNHEPTIMIDTPSQEFPADITSINVILQVTSNRFVPPFDIYVNGFNRGKTNDAGGISLTLAVPGEYEIYAAITGTGKSPDNPSLTVKYGKEAPPATEDPQANPGSGEVLIGDTVTLSCATVGAIIFYTTDGSEPTTASTQYSSPIEITQDTTIKAMAVKEGHNQSSTVTWDYVIATAPAPVISPNGGEVLTTTDITLSTSLSEASIYYSKEGIPSENSTLYESPINLNGPGNIKAICIHPKYKPSEISSASFTIKKVATPTSNKASGDFTKDLSVTLSCTTPGSKIYYTTDGSTPTKESSLYTEAIKVTAKDTTIKAIAYAEGYIESDVATFTYTYVQEICATPTASVASGTVDKGTTVTLSTTTEGASIYYTTDGSTPTSSSTLYTGAITLNEDITIKAIAIKTGNGNSSVATFTYTINMPTAAAPTASIASGTQVEYDTKVSLSTTTPGGTIYYTLDGSTPTTSSSEYKGPIVIKGTVNIKAITVAEGYRDSSVASFTYSLWVNPIVVETSVNQTVAIRGTNTVSQGTLKSQAVTANTRTTIVIGKALTTYMTNALANNNLTYVDVSKLDTNPVMVLSGFFSNNPGLTTVEGLRYWVLNKCTDMVSMFQGCTNLETLDVSYLDTTIVENFQSMFEGCTNLKTLLGIEDWKVPSLKSMETMFYMAMAITSLDLSKWRPNNLQTLRNTFNLAKKLTSLNITGWATPLLSELSGTFSSCSSLTEIKGIEYLNTANVTSMSNCFNSCSKLTNLDLSRWSTGKVTSIGGMFYGCSGLTELNLSDWDTSKITSLSQAFRNCRNLTSLDLSSFSTPLLKDMYQAFNGCTNLESLDVSNLDVSKVPVLDTSQESHLIFSGCDSLTHIKCRQAFKDWCIANASKIGLPEAMKEGGSGTWEII